MKWCFVTIGESPRDDLVPELLPIIGDNFNYTEKGLLDGLSSSEIQGMNPQEGDEVQVSRLKSGEQVIMGHKKVERALSDLIDKETSCDAILLLCTSEFKSLMKKRGGKLIIMPSLVLKEFLKSFILPFDSLGVVVPESSQVADAEQKWRKIIRNVYTTHLSPYLVSDESEWEKVSSFFLSKKVNYIVMDCMGYSVSYSRKLSELSNLPVFAARVIAGNFLRNFVI
jgi:protein AroM